MRRVRILTPKAQEQYQEEVHRYRDVLLRFSEDIKSSMLNCATCTKDINVLTLLEEKLQTVENDIKIFMINSVITLIVYIQWAVWTC